MDIAILQRLNRIFSPKMGEIQRGLIVSGDNPLPTFPNLGEENYRTNDIGQAEGLEVSNQ